MCISSDDIAVIGIACRFPGARNYNEYWELIINGKSGVVSLDESDRQGFEASFSKDYHDVNKSHSRWCGVVEDAGSFDARFFGISPKEARQMDPQQRLLLEEVWKCIEDSGVSLRSLQEKTTSVYVGAMTNDYQQISSRDAKEVNSYTALGNYNAILANRISYHLGLSGESFAIDAACASSLFAINEAKKTLLLGESDFAIAAGVNLNLDPWKYVSFSKARMLSPSGSCKTFDMSADGYVPGDGVGVLLLERAQDAKKNKRHIYGIIKAVKGAHGGATASITAPSVSSQYKLIEEAYTEAGVEPESVGYIEAHGTGTSLGDPIEVESLSRFLGPYFGEERRCYIGSIKPNIGHLEAAAGVAGVIKVLLMMKHRQIPPSILLNKKNPIIDFSSAPFDITTLAKDWISLERKPLRASVSSFGFGGAISHCVIEQPLTETPAKTTFLSKGACVPPLPFLLSAKSRKSLSALINNWRHFIETDEFTDTCFESICHTLVSGRESFDMRLAGVVTSKHDLKELLSMSLSEQVPKVLGFSIDNLSDISFSPQLQKHLLDVVDSELACQIREEQPVFNLLALVHWLKQSGVPLVAVSVSSSGQLNDALQLTGMLDASESQPSDVSGEIRPNSVAVLNDQWQRLGPTDVEYLNLVQPVLFSLASEQRLESIALFASDLIEHQHTFIKFIQEWEVQYKDLLGREILIASLIKNVEEIAALSDRDRLFSILAIENACRKIGEKWDINLFGRVCSGPDEITDLSWLLSVGSLKLKNVIGIIFEQVGARPTVLTVPSGVENHERLNSFFTGHCYSAITAGLEKKKGGLTLVFSNEEYRSVPSGLVPINDIASRTPLELLTFVWQQGLNVDWSGLPFAESVRSVPLPSYCFDSKPYWLALKADNQVDLLSAQSGLQLLSGPALGGEHVSMSDAHLSEVTPQAADLAEIRLFSPEWVPVGAFGEYGGARNLIVTDKNLSLNGFECYRWEARGELLFDGITGSVNVILDIEIEQQESLDQEALLNRVFELIRDVANRRKVESGHLLVNVSLASTDTDKHAGELLDNVTQTRPVAAAIFGILNSLRLEYPKWSSTLIEHRQSGLSARFVDERLRGLVAAPRSASWFLVDKPEILKRHFAKVDFQKSDTDQQKNVRKDFSSTNNKPVYLLPGATGSFGQTLIRSSRFLADKTCVILGRGANPPELLFELPLGLEVSYRQCDMTDEASVTDTLRDVRKHYGVISGVIYCAGVLDDQLMAGKPLDSFNYVYRAKARGAEILSRLTGSDPIEDFVLFSSIVASIGNVGQVDYAAANNFLEGLAELRNVACRRNNTLSIAWPLLGGEGMGGSDQVIENFARRGLSALPQDSAVALFDQLLYQKYRGVVVVSKDGDQLQENLPSQLELSEAAQIQNENSEQESMSEQDRLVNRIAQLVALFADKMECEEEDIDIDESVFSQGVESVLLQEVMAALESGYEGVTPTFIFEYPSIRDMAEHLAEKGVSSDSVLATNMSVKDLVEPEFIQPEKSKVHAVDVARYRSQDIAIIGINGRFPEADNLEVFWQNLSSGKDCIKEVPEERWAHSKYFDQDKFSANKTYGRWGGFINNVDKFDAKFFNISPVEAEQLDPQQRLFTQCSWHALEDAGYGAAERYQDKEVGVYVGVMWNEYSHIVNESSHQQGQYNGPGSIYWAIANRVSYSMNLSGPSMAIDTACSSSMTAIHLACQGIVSGDCDMAIAGGVNLSIHPYKYLYLGQSKFLSTDGRCRSFGEGGDGYVPGEGVAALILKSAEQAMKDGDRIYGIIKGSAVNHGGKATGFTVPSPEAQAKVIKRTLERSGVESSQISYVECHGTGTALGDPIEIRGLTNAFANTSEERCWIGSLKSNIGHLEAAAGVAAVIKTVLSMKNKVLPKSLHNEDINPNLVLSDTPFEVLRDNQPWGVNSDQPVVAAVSSFGAGGSNAHMIIEAPVSSFTGTNTANPVTAAEQRTTFLLNISARSQVSLSRYVESICQFLSDNPNELGNLCYTFQLGRKAFEHRMAVFTKGPQECIEVLSNWLKNGEQDEFLVTGRVAKNTMTRTDPVSLNTNTSRELVDLAKRWTAGEFDRFIPTAGKILSAPTYPFDEKRYWIASAEEISAQPNTGFSAQGGAEERSDNEYPLVVKSQRGSKEFDISWHAQESYFADHVVGGTVIFPGVGYIEAALESAALHWSKGAFNAVKQVFWQKPAIGSGAEKMLLGLQQNGANTEFTVSSSAGEVYSKGQLARYEGGYSPITYSGEYALYLDKASCYQLFSQLGFEYGPRFQVIENVRFDQSGALATLALPEALDDRSYIMHPALMDGVLQSAIVVIKENLKSQLGQFYPFNLGEFALLESCKTVKFARVSLVGKASSSVLRFTIDLLDEQQKLVGFVKDLLMQVKQSTERKGTQVTHASSQALQAKVVGEPVHYYAVDWRPLELLPDTGALDARIAIVDLESIASQPETLAFRLSRSFQSQSTEIQLIRVPVGQLELESVITIASVATLQDQITIVLLPEFTKQLVDFERRGNEVYRPHFELFKALNNLARKTRVKVVYSFNCDRLEDSSIHYAVAGLCRALSRENPRFSGKLVDLTDSPETAWNVTLENECKVQWESVEVVQYRQASRHVEAITYQPQIVQSHNNKTDLVSAEGVVLISGGLGGLGLIFARHLLDTTSYKVALLGRSELDATKRRLMADLDPSGQRARYHSLNVTNYQQLSQVVGELRQQFGSITGVLHCAGVTRDSLLANKMDADIRAVTEPKIAGSLCLDRVTAQDPLSFFVLFSSVSSVMGNVGQTDYAYANSFMDHFAAERMRLRARGLRHGRSVSINWPLWRSGGMQVDDRAKEWLASNLGIIPLETFSGCAALDNIIISEMSQVVVASGYKEKLDRALNAAGSTDVRDSVMSVATSADQVESTLVSIFYEALKIEQADLDLDESFEDLGVDSILMMNIMNQIEQKLGFTLDPNALVTHRNISLLAKHLQNDLTSSISSQVSSTAAERTPPETKKTRQDYGQSVVTEIICNVLSGVLKIPSAEIDHDEEFSALGMDSILIMNVMNILEGELQAVLEPDVMVNFTTINRLAGHLIGKGVNPVQLQDAVQHQVLQSTDSVEPTAMKASHNIQAKLQHTERESSDTRIAVVSVAGRFPDSPSLEVFWDKLLNGESMTSPIPANRWSGAAHTGEYPDWIGYMRDIESFDADYFGIKEDDAIVMDPQHRIILELTEELLARGGYLGSDLEGTNTGVFIGGGESEYINEYKDHFSPEQRKHIVVNRIQNMMAARVSDFYDLKGPAQLIDTACSSSLVAIHNACSALLNGEVDIAISGGIEIHVNDKFHQGFYSAGVLATNGKTQVFDQSASGFVLGEAAGLVMLKRYEDAINDGDIIKAVIQGSAVNNDGRTMGITVPSMEGQKRVIQSALNNAKLSAQDVSYLEAHGTGTLLGDPIEIQAATQVYRSYSDDKQYCAVGSVKSNIGHTLRAAGIASFIKVVLSIENKVIPPTLHCDEPHPRFNFANSPFAPVTVAQQWSVHSGRRVAAISSFGFGGTNCHMIVAEPERVPGTTSRRPLALPLFKKKRFWPVLPGVQNIIKDIDKCDLSHQNSEEIVRSVLWKLKRGQIDKASAVAMLKAKVC